MIKIKYLILGAGPSGLSFAHRLLELGETSFLILEKESECGGLCRSKLVADSPIDIGGGHFLDTKRKNVLSMLFRFLPEEEWNLFNRKSPIFYDNKEIDYPFESNLWQLSIDQQVKFLKSISNAGSNRNTAMPKRFKEWIKWKLGDQIAEEYMLPYNDKIWSIDLDELGTYWLYKLPNVSFEDTLRSCLTKSLQGSLPAHGQFYYPKQYGYGEVWSRMGDALGNKLILNERVQKINFHDSIVNDKYSAQTIIMTIPWQSTICSNSDMSSEIRESVAQLKYNSIRVTYNENNLSTDAHWIYVPDKSIDHHRLLIRHNFCAQSKGYWTETNLKRAKHTNAWHHDNEFAYPLNTLNKPESINKILSWARKYNVYGLGRWGEWEHMNSDVSVEKGIELANKLAKYN